MKVQKLTAGNNKNVAKFYFYIGYVNVINEVIVCGFNVIVQLNIMRGKKIKTLA